MTTKQIVSAYNLINPAKLSKMDDADKFKTIKAIRVMKPIAETFEGLVKDAREKLKDENHEDMQERANKWNEKHGQTRQRLDIPAEDLKELEVINAYFHEYSVKVDKCIEEEADQEHELSFDKLTEEAFGKFIASNDFDVKSIIELQDVLTAQA